MEIEAVGGRASIKSYMLTLARGETDPDSATKSSKVST